MCEDKETMIQSQYLVVDGLKNMTELQDRLSRAKDTALKILQNTVYQMVDKIAECGHAAVHGLQQEIAALQASIWILIDWMKNSMNFSPIYKFIHSFHLLNSYLLINHY